MSRARSLSIEAVYQPLPQAEDERGPADIELDGESNVANTPVSDPLPVVDTLIRWIHFMLGCAVLLPWNVMITATPFFLSRLEGTSLRPAFTSWMTSSLTVANLIALAHATVTSKRTSPSRQTRAGLGWLVVLTSSLTLSTFFVPSPGIFYAFVIFNGAAQAVVGSYLQTSVIAVASLFGPLAVQAMMFGQAAVAVVLSAVQVLSVAASTHGKPKTYVTDSSAEDRSAFFFFFVATAFLVVSGGLHTWLVRMPVYQHVAAPLEQPPKKSPTQNALQSERQGLISTSHSNGLSDKANVLRVAKLNAPYEVAVAYVFMVTLAVFPPITASVVPTNPNTHPLLFTTVHFLVFNAGDFIGRYACSFPALHVWSSKRLLLLSGLRTLFIPLFLMCNIQRGPISSSIPPFINSDFLFMTILFGFAWSNGYVSSLCMMAAPSLEHNPRLRGRAEDVDLAATVANFCLISGLALGSFASFGVRAMVCNCNPFVS